MSKKGQISLFILIGIVVVIIVGLFFYQRAQVVKTPEIKMPVNILPVQTAVQSCFESTAKNAVLAIAARGGYFDENISSSSYSSGFTSLNVPYYVEGGIVNVPEKRVLEEQIGKYVDFNLKNCMLFFNDFNRMGYQFGFKEPKTNVSINSKNIIFTLNFPISVQFNSDTAQIQKFETLVDTDLLDVLDASREFSVLQAKQKNAFLFGSLVNLGKTNDFQFKLINVKSDMIITLIDSKTPINNKPLVFSFAIKFNQQNI